jgi:hypothetical protein
MARNETKYMESVIALSEELDFTLAAQKVHVSPGSGDDGNMIEEELP